MSSRNSTISWCEKDGENDDEKTSKKRLETYTQRHRAWQWLRQVFVADVGPARHRAKVGEFRAAAASATVKEHPRLPTHPNTARRGPTEGGEPPEREHHSARVASKNKGPGGTLC